MKHFYFVGLLLVLISLALVSFQQAGLRDDQVVSYQYTPGKEQLNFYWKDDRGRIIGSLGNLKNLVAARHQQLLFAMNGGMYMVDRTPQGLYIEQGKTLHAMNRNTGFGNFYMKPNGLFYVNANGQAAVCATEAFRPSKNIRYVTQSGPMLVIDGHIHPQFKEGSRNLTIRNGVGILPDNRVLLVMSKEEVNFFDFAEYFRRKGCRNALYLDGFVSRTYYPARRFEQTDGSFGVMIGVVK